LIAKPPATVRRAPQGITTNSTADIDVNYN